MKKLLILFLFICSITSAQISITPGSYNYQQNFNTLSNTGTSSTLPIGWYLSESGSNANALYTAGNGSGNSGDTYSFGATSNSERAFGGIQSGSLIPTFGVTFTNNTGVAITQLDISYVGEQWRLGSTGRADRIDFQYSTNATSLNSGTWIDANDLDFTSPITAGTVGALDGNASANRTPKTFTVTGLNIPNGATIWIRWTDFNATSSDDGLAVDDFSLTVNTGSSAPNPPVATSATNISQTSFTANWNSVNGATKYLLDVSKVNDFSTFVSGYNGKDVGNGTSSSVTGLGADSTYYYRVRSNNASGTSGNSNIITVVTLPNAPTAPIANAATNVSQTGMTANWGSVGGATKYFLDVSEASDFSTFVTNLENKDVGNVVTYDLTGLTSGTTYYYRVRAYNTGGTSGNSNTISKKLIPANPATNAATNKTQTSFTANWGTVNGASLYLVDVSTTKNFTSYVTGYQNKDVGMNSVSVTGLTAATEYFYRVRAQNPSGTSGNSNVDSVETLPNPPAAPVASAGTAISSSSFTANWSDVPEATTNFITVSTDSSFASSTVDNLEVGDVTNYTVNGLTPATVYYYVVKAGNTGGTSSNSNRIKVTTNPGVPGAPVATNATNITNVSFSANWNTVGGASNYLVTVATDSNFTNIVGSYNEADAANASSLSITGLNASTDYYYRVKSSNITGQSGNSNRIKATTNPPAPNAPVATAATNKTSSGFTANWNTVSGADKYLITVAADSDFVTPLMSYNDFDAGNVATLNITGLIASTDYYYRVKASNVTGNSANSNRIKATTNPAIPNAPVATSATNITTTGFTANWNTVSGADKYLVTVAPDSDFVSPLAGYNDFDAGNASLLNITGLNASTNYYYRVKSSNVSGQSSNSNKIKATTNPVAPTAPVATAGSSIAATSFTANWNATAGATKYYLDVSTANDFSTFVTGFQNKDVGNVTTYSVTGLTAGTPYHYRVRAFNISGTSSSSNVINVTTSSSGTQTLVAGDIAIIGINGDDPDQFSFVPLVDLQAGTVIRFSDSGVKADGTFRTGEGAVKYTTPAGGTSAGTILTFTSPASGNFATDNDATVGTNGVALSTSGDQIIAFQGLSTNPTFLYAITTLRNTFAADAGSSNETALPTGLTNGTTAIAVGGASSDNDNAVYNMSTTTGSRNELLAAIGNVVNWSTSNTLLTMPSGNFIIGAPAIPSAPVANAASGILSNGFTANWNASSGATKYYLDIATDNLFVNKLASYDNKDVGNTTSASVTGLSANTPYYYQVRANNSAGTSVNSNVINVTTASPGITTVQFVSTSGSVTEITGTYTLTLSIANPDATNATQCQIAFISGISTANLADINNYTTQTVTFPAGSSTNQTIIITIPNDSNVEPTETAFFQIQSVSGGNLATSGTNAQFSLSISDGGTDYYSTITSGLTGSALRTALHNLIKNHVKLNYTGSGTDVWSALQQADEDPSNASNVKLLYSGRSYAKNNNGGSVGQWNREHVWAQSRGGFDTSPGPGTDIHHLKPEDVTVNSDRGNKDFDNGGTTYSGIPDIKYTSTTWEPPNSVKGDVARMMFYMDVRYEGTNGEPDLVVVDQIGGATGTIGKLSTLLAWHQQDPPDAFEINRNNIAYSIQQNKNPFIDHPEWVNSIWGSTGAPLVSNVTRNLKVPDHNQNLIVTADVTDDGSLTSVQIKYIVDTGTEQSVTMNLTTGNTYTGTIPESDYNNGNLLKYRISAVDNQANTTHSQYNQLFTGITDISVLHQIDGNGVQNYTNTYFKINGVATVSSGVFSTTGTEVNIQDATGGIVVFKNPGTTNITMGKNYTVTGSLTQYNGLAELIPDNLTTDIIDNGTGVLPSPIVRTIAQLLASPETYEGQLIKVVNMNKTSGTWASSQTLNINDGTGTNVTLRISSGTDIASNAEPTWPQDVVGLFTQFDSSSPYTDGYQLKPRAFSDFSAGSSAPNTPVATAATSVASTAFNANWNSTAGATKYFLDVATDNGFLNKLTNYDNKDVGSVTTHAITGLTPTTQYFYRVRSFNTNGTSASSNIINITTLSNQTVVQFSSAVSTISESAGTFNLVFTIANPDAVNATTFQVALTGGTGSSNDINNYSTQNVTFPAGSSANQTIILTITNDAIAEGNETLIFTIQNISGGNNALAGTQSTFTLTLTDPVAGYYSGVNTTLNGSSFKAELHNLIKGHTPFPYTSSSTDVWDILSHAYQDPSNSSNVILIYTGRSQAKTYNASTNSSDPNAWNREHIWAQSRGGFDVDNFPHNPGVASDAHNLAPEDASVNTDRSNKDFDIGGTPHSEAIGSFMDSDSFEPRDAVKGDVARMLFYMDVRYEGDNGEVQLELMDGVNTPVGTIGKLSTLLLWHQQDPPDAFEINRNNVIYSYQQNKNPFIDNPEWVSKIYGANAAPIISNISRSIKVPAENQNTTISANIIDDGSVASAQIIYTIDNSNERSVNMSFSSGTSFSGTIPESEYVDGNLLTYKIKAIDNQSNERLSESYRVFTGRTPITTLHQTNSNGVILYTGVYARVNGVATVQNGLFSTSNLEVNLQDATGGIVVYKVTAGSTPFVVGRNYTVIGSLTQYNGLAEIIPDNATTDIIDGGVGTLVQPTVRTFAQLMTNPESYEGMLIKVLNVNKTAGTWANSQNLNVNDGTSSAVTVRVSSGTNLASNPEPSWPKDIVGVYTQFDNSSPFTEGYQLKPRSILDIQDATPIITATKYIVTSTNYNPIVGNRVTISAQLADASNNSVATAGKVVTWNSTNGGSFSSPTSVTNSNGIATVDFTPSTTSEVVHMVSVIDNSAPAPLTGSTLGITTRYGDAVKYIVTADSYNPVVNSTINVNAQLVDAYNNLVKTSGSTVIFSSSNGGIFEQHTVLTNFVGRAEVRFAIPKQAGIVLTITASDNALLNGTTALITSKASSPSAYKLISSSYQPTAGSNISLTSQLIDEFENPIAHSGKVINWSVNNGGVFASQSTTNDAEGKSTVQLTVSKNAGIEHLVEIIDNSLTPLKGKSAVIKTISGVEAKYIVTISNNKPFSGTTITITAQLVDINNNQVQKAGKVISWSSTGGGIFSSPTSTTDNTGKATVEFTASVVSSTNHIVTATDASSISGISESFITNAIDTPKLAYPKNNSVHIPLTYTLSWLPTATAESYELVVSTDKNFTDNVQVFSNFSLVSKEIANLHKATTYFWKVRAKKGIAYSSYSEIWSFNTVPNLPSKPILSLPLSSSMNIRVNSVFTWQYVEGADNYILQLAEDAAFTKLVEYVNTEVFNSVKGLKNSQNYFWRVKAANFSGESDFSDVWTFTTIDTIYAPSELTATVDNNFNINLEWKDNSNNETEFTLERLDEGNVLFYQFDKVAANTTQYVNTSLEQGKTFTYRIKAINDNTKSPYSNLLTVVVPSASINSPSNVKTTVNSNGHIILTWNDNSNDEIGFIVYRAEFVNTFGKISFSSVNTGLVPIDTIRANTTIYLDNTTTFGKTYSYQVVTLTKQGVSIPSAAANPIKPLVAPTNLKAILEGSNAKLTWVDKSNDETGFIILRAAKPQMNLKKIDSTLANVNTFTDNTIFDGRKFHYKVFAIDKSFGISGESNSDSVYLNMKPPTNLKALQQLNKNLINLSWADNSSSESGYIIERKESGIGIFSEIGTVLSNVVSYSDATVANKKNYIYRIRGYNEDGNSSYSAESSLLVGVERENEKPVNYALQQNYPNPFNPSTTINYSLPERAFVKLRIFDMLGKEIALLINAEQESGTYKYIFNATSLSSGTYFYILETDKFREVKKLILVK